MKIRPVKDIFLSLKELFLDVALFQNIYNLKLIYEKDDFTTFCSSYFAI